MNSTGSHSKIENDTLYYKNKGDELRTIGEYKSAIV